MYLCIYESIYLSLYLSPFLSIAFALYLSTSSPPLPLCSLSPAPSLSPRTLQDTICAPFLAGLAELWVVLAAAGFVILCVFIAFPCVTRIEEQGPGSDKALYGTDDGRTGVMVGGSSGVTHDLHSGQVRTRGPYAYIVG